MALMQNASIMFAATEKTLIKNKSTIDKKEYKNARSLIENEIKSCKDIKKSLSFISRCYLYVLRRMPHICALLIRLGILQ